MDEAPDCDNCVKVWLFEENEDAWELLLRLLPFSLSDINGNVTLNFDALGFLLYEVDECDWQELADKVLIGFLEIKKATKDGDGSA